MKVDDELKELRERESRARAAILKLASEVRTVLIDDIARYPVREVKRRFVANPAFAQEVDDEVVARLKSELATLGETLRAQASAALEPPDLWIAGIDIAAEGKTFAENTALWQPMMDVAAAVQEVLVRYRFPDAETDPADYRMPTWFINGKYLPGLAEKYWHLMAELRDLRTRIDEIEQSRIRDNLAKRWDKL